MSIEILMPALSPTMTEGKLIKWLKKEGDKVVSGDVIAEIETDKATMEVEAADEGILGKIIVAEGTDAVPVNSPIAVLVEDGEDFKENEAKNEDDFKDEEKGDEMTDASYELDEDLNDDIDDDFSDNDERVVISPLARKVAQEAGVDIADIQGTGHNGRITKADVERAVASKQNSSSSAVAISDENKMGLISSVEMPSYKDVPLTGMRKVIAQRMQESKQNIPHFYLTIDCELENLEKARKELNQKAEQLGLNYKLTINDFVVKAVAMAMRKVPQVNVSWNEDSIRMYNNVDVAVAVSTPGGLFTPVIRNVDRRRLPDISRSIKNLAEKARAGKLVPEEYQGGNFTISNLGMYGIKDFSAIINPPQSCILSIGKAEQRLIVREGSIAVANMMTCTLSVDHRAVDGATAAEFLAKFKQILEEPLVMML
ncbi:MAG: pyruvate dehydrogenase complex dihydrolipoamide acetyltransferase [Alphaproteobacteria bacterium]